jgi:hypothetical protein
MNKLLIFIVLLIAITSCKKSAYLTDDGIHTAKSPLSTYDYLKQHSWKSFDTLITIIDHFNLKEEVNRAGTFFAITNNSIKRYMDIRLQEKRLTNAQAMYSLDSLFKEMTADSLRQYLFTEKLTLADASKTQPVPYTSKANTPFALWKQLQTSSTYTQYTSGAVYLLYFVKVRGELDSPLTTPPQNEIDINVQCQTTGIEPSSGGILHVLSNQHTFVRF